MDLCWVWWHTQRQVDLFEFKASLVYKVSSRPAGAAGIPCLKKTK